jgi:hypothetical protein
MGRTAEAEVEFEKSKSLNKAADEGLIKAMTRVPHSDSAPHQAVPAPSVK